MGILKDAILAAIQQEHPDAHWVGNEKTPHDRIYSASKIQ